MTIATAASSANRRVACVVRFLLLGDCIDAGPFSFDGNDHVVGNTDDLVARAPGRNSMHADLVRTSRRRDPDRAFAVSYDDDYGCDSVTPFHGAAVGTKVIGPSVDCVPVASTRMTPMMSWPWTVWKSER